MERAIRLFCWARQVIAAHKRLRWAALLTLLCTLATLILFHPHWGNSTPLLRVTFLDVGQGDSAVIETPSGKTVVIDGGGHPDTDERWGTDPGSRVVVPFLRSRGINRVDLLVPTHPDDDHVSGPERRRAAVSGHGGTGRRLSGNVGAVPAPDGPIAPEMRPGLCRAARPADRSWGWRPLRDLEPALLRHCLRPLAD